MSSPEHLSRSEGERPPGQVTCGHLLDTRVGTASWDPGRHQGPVKAAAGAVSDAFHKNKPHTKDGKKKKSSTHKTNPLPAPGKFRFSLLNDFVLRGIILCFPFCATATSPTSKTKHSRQPTGTSRAQFPWQQMEIFSPHSLTHLQNRPEFL